MTQLFLEAFQWHGVKREAFAFYAGDIRVEARIPSAPAGAISGTGAPAPPCTPIASNSSGHCRPAAGHGPGRDRARGVHHPQQRRLDHVRKYPS